MARNKGKRRKADVAVKTAPAARPQPGADRVVVILAGIGMLITGYLTLVAWMGGGPLLCAEGSGCDLIQQSRWSRVLGLPVALWGFLVYALLALTAVKVSGRLKRWRRLWFVSLVGVAISVYLTAVGLIHLDALCAWCLASLATITAIFLWVTFRRPETAPGQPWGFWLANNFVVTAVILGTLHLYYSDLLSPRPDPRLVPLAQHLTEAGVRYYGAYWCPACQQQNRLFRGAYEHLPYVECSPDGRHGRPAPACVRAGISTFPTWVIDGRRYEEVLTPAELADYSGFDWAGARQN
ncbi:Vitamin K epoxide reductase [Thioalkalivibrio denitrificans]|uniref:Vitamin K epoxide reductase n=2 Tax=Thioalkalivibrio denitrificans TaxID=108003 RepID=A0A1V3NK09_9GAMM|nr:Vitamin K epoxide reductase [Thioalkalivibrio denitrificans]